MEPKLMDKGISLEYFLVKRKEEGLSSEAQP
jgi:hypothetical protein